MRKVWMVYPNITPPSLVEAAADDAANPPVPRPPRVEYLATLNRHSAPVNVVRFSPNGAISSLSLRVMTLYLYPRAVSGELIASAGDGVHSHSSRHLSCLSDCKS